MMMAIKSMVEYFQEDGFWNVQFKGWKGDITYLTGCDGETNEDITLEVIPSDSRYDVNIYDSKNKCYGLMTIEKLN